jgi:hypothetical protein
MGAIFREFKRVCLIPLGGRLEWFRRILSGRRGPARRGEQQMEFDWR